MYPVSIDSDNKLKSVVTDTVVEKSVKINKMSEAYRTKLFQLGAFVLVRVRIFIVMFSNILKINR